MPLSIHWIDAFTQVPFAGNPAVVVPQAEGLSGSQMQQIAREVNCSETAFICSATHPEADLMLRWFTPKQEVDLCGHATVAAMHALVNEGQFNLHKGTTQILYLETRSGLIPVTVDYTDTVEWIWMTLPLCEFESVEAAIAQELIQILGLPNPKRFQHLPVVDSLNHDVLVAVDHLPQLHALEPDFPQLARLGHQQHWRGVCVYTTETVEQSHAAHSRFFAPQAGILEDPVTGSVSGPLALYLNRTQQLQDKVLPQEMNEPGCSELILEQGDCIGRPGRVRIQLTPTQIRLGGQAITVMQGDLQL
jgi:PhzF family phenazine biosynthesis protein